MTNHPAHYLIMEEGGEPFRLPYLRDDAHRWLNGAAKKAKTFDDIAVSAFRAIVHPNFQVIDGPASAGVVVETNVAGERSVAIRKYVTHAISITPHRWAKSSRMIVARQACAYLLSSVGLGVYCGNQARMIVRSPLVVRDGDVNTGRPIVARMRSLILREDEVIVSPACRDAAALDRQLQEAMDGAVAKFMATGEGEAFMSTVDNPARIVASLRVSEVA